MDKRTEWAQVGRESRFEHVDIAAKLVRRFKARIGSNVGQYLIIILNARKIAPYHMNNTFTGIFGTRLAI